MGKSATREMEVSFQKVRMRESIVGEMAMVMAAQCRLREKNVSFTEDLSGVVWLQAVHCELKGAWRT